MDLKQLMYFAAVVEEGSITAAAKRLHLSQPPLSHQMKCLEEELGLQLMERGARHITLTAAGKVFYQRAKNLLQLADSTQKEMRAIRQGLAGTLTLGGLLVVGLRAFNHPAFLVPQTLSQCLL